MQAKSNKPRGAVLIAPENNPGTNKTANPQRKAVNQARGPQTGNAGTPVKQKSFLAEKSDRSSRMSSLADMVSSAFGRRGSGMKPNQPATEDPKALRGISPNTNVGRGPRRG